MHCPFPGHLEPIGFGDCGSVWATLKSWDEAHSKTPIVIKLENASAERDITNEVSVQLQVCTIGLVQASVPQCLGFMHRSDSRWNQVLMGLPTGFRACRAMISEKIEPISIEAQRSLVYSFAPDRKRDELEQLFHNGKGQHCLVRIYLGQRRQQQLAQRRPDPHCFSLRNFPLHIDQAEELTLNCEEYALAMAEALAMLHWKLRTDGAGVEFVLGARRGYTLRDPVATVKQHATLWILDFDSCRPIEANESGLESIARAFWCNDPFYPRPDGACEADQKLWYMFAAEYARVGIETVHAYRREGEDFQTLCTLVDGALAKIMETKEKWTNAA